MIDIEIETDGNLYHVEIEVDLPPEGLQVPTMVMAFNQQDVPLNQYPWAFNQ